MFGRKKEDINRKGQLLQEAEYALTKAKEATREANTTIAQLRGNKDESKSLVIDIETNSRKAKENYKKSEKTLQEIEDSRKVCEEKTYIAVKNVEQLVKCKKDAEHMRASLAKQIESVAEIAKKADIPKAQRLAQLLDAIEDGKSSQIYKDFLRVKRNLENTIETANNEKEAFRQEITEEKERAKKELGELQDIIVEYGADLLETYKAERKILLEIAIRSQDEQEKIYGAVGVLQEILQKLYEENRELKESMRAVADTISSTGRVSLDHIRKLLIAADSFQEFDDIESLPELQKRLHRPTEEAS